MMFFVESISIMQTKDGRMLFFSYHNNTNHHLKIFSIDLCVNILILFFFHIIIFVSKQEKNNEISMSSLFNMGQKKFRKKRTSVGQSIHLIFVIWLIMWIRFSAFLLSSIFNHPSTLYWYLLVSAAGHNQSISETKLISCTIRKNLKWIFLSLWFSSHAKWNVFR